MRLIDADALMERYGEPCHSFADVIEDMPTIEAKPVRHGLWAHKYYPTVWYGPGEPPEWICSECQDRAYNTYDYCPNCGAKMGLEG